MKLGWLVILWMAWPWSLSAATNDTIHPIESLDRRYAAQARTLADQGQRFDAIFRALCQQVLAEAPTKGTRRLEDNCRAMFGGLWLWAKADGRPQLQRMEDKALHFIAGGVFQGYLDAGRAAAVAKEELDRRNPNNAFDLDDMAATMMGARWVDLATTDHAEANRQWIRLWANGDRSLDKSLLKLEFGKLPDGAEATPELIAAIQSKIAQSMTLTASSAP